MFPALGAALSLCLPPRDTLMEWGGLWGSSGLGIPMASGVGVRWKSPWLAAWWAGRESPQLIVCGAGVSPRLAEWSAGIYPHSAGWGAGWDIPLVHMLEVGAPTWFAG